MAPPLFAYGTLMFPQVFLAVTGVERAMAPASLEGYARYSIKRQHFPGIVPEPGATVVGKLVAPIDAGLWHCLDEFESDFYERISVRVLDHNERAITAQTYVVTPARRHLLATRAWSPQRFGQHHLRGYLAAST